MITSMGICHTKPNALRGVPFGETMAEVLSRLEDSHGTTRHCPVHLRIGQTLVHQESMGPPLCLRPLCFNNAAYKVPPYAWTTYLAHEVPLSPDYILGPEEPQSPPLLDFVPEPYSPGYVPESDPEEEPEEDDEDPEEDPADY
ncbi:hypothetical protein Tco_0083487 [Tanacetum coccineum]